jgi:pimeloyl-ACP methyl ester carboxylesterase
MSGIDGGMPAALDTARAVDLSWRRRTAASNIGVGGKAMTFPVSEHVAKSKRHTSFYLAGGAARATPIIFLHGWPELSISWRHQLPVFASLGFRALAPDMRGYGRSSVYTRHQDYALEEIVADMIELLDAIGAEKAVWVGHDWGSPVVWSIAQQHPQRCHGVANLCVPYIPEGFAVETVAPLADRKVYPQDRFPAAQWDYRLFYRENFAAARAGFESNVRASVRALFRAGNPANKGKPVLTAFVRANGGWFGSQNTAPDLPRDAAVLTEEDENRYVAALERNGFFGPDSWYMNDEASVAYAARAKANWRLTMPVLFLHGAYDYVCETIDSRLAEPMRANCADLTEVTVPSGHWMAQEKPTHVNAALAKWLAVEFPALWTSA